MTASILSQVQPFFSGEAVAALLMMTLVGATELIIACGLLYGLYFLLTLPMRRNEKARVFLDLLELGLNEGRSPEGAIVDAAAGRDPSLGSRFQRLAAQLQTGIRLSKALTNVPGIVPAQLTAMLAAGERIGDLTRVLPACRRMLNDGVSQVRGALNYLLIVTFLLMPFTIAVPIIINIVVLPKFKEVFHEMLSGAPLPAFTSWAFANTGKLSILLAGVYFLVWIVVVAYLGGPRMRSWIRDLWPGIAGLFDEIAYRLPWRRKRLQRDFSALLAVLLDSEVAEADAVRLAAEATNNTVVSTRAYKVCALLANGVPLPTAIRAMDDSGELQWRLTNALRRGRGFVRALNGWNEALDAKAFQLEQAAAQSTTSALVLLNGAVVAVVVIAMFLALIGILNGVALW